MDELAKEINRLLEESEKYDKVGLTQCSMEMLGQAAELEVKLLQMKKEEARKRTVNRLVNETIAKCEKSDAA